MLFVRTKQDKSGLKALANEALILRFVETAEEACFAEIFDRYAHLVYLNCRGYGLSREEAKDLCMRVFGKVYRVLPEGQVRSFEAWLYEVTKNECLDHLRILKLQRQFIADLEQMQKNDDSFVENEEFERLFGNGGEDVPQAVQAAMALLSAEQHLCISLFYFDGKTYKEIAAATAFSEKQVKSHIQNGKRRLKKALAER